MGKRFVVWLVAILLFVPVGAHTQDGVASRVVRALLGAGIPVVGISVVDTANRATWKVQPPELQAAAQPVIDAFDANDPAYLDAELTVQVASKLDTERLTSAVVWTILKQMFPADTDAQTRTKFGVARTRIIDVYKARPWVAP